MQPTFRSQLFIGGDYVPAASGKTFPVLNPANNEASFVGCISCTIFIGARSAPYQRSEAGSSKLRPNKERGLTCLKPVVIARASTASATARG